MQNEQQILDYFRNEIERESKEEAESILKETEKIREEALEKIKHQASIDANAKMNREIDEIILENKKEISQMQRETNEKLILRRQKLQNEIFDICKEKLLDFTKSNEYFAFLEKEIANLPEEIYEGSLVIKIAKKDEDTFKKLASQFKNEVKFVIDGQISIGGFIATNQEMGLIIDNSLDDRLEEQKEWFWNHSGLVIQ